MTLFWRIPIELVLRAPWVVPGYQSPGPRFDIALARNDGHYILPATMIKGNLRDAMDQLVAEQLVEADLRDHLFGTPSGSRRTGPPTDQWVVDNEPERAALHFPDLVSANPAPEQPKRIARVKIDPDFGAVAEGHLAFIECPYSFGDTQAFKGEAILLNTSVRSAEIPDPDHVTEAIQLALGRVFAIGQMKSVGFGRVEKRALGTAVKVIPASIKPASDHVAIRYSLDRPFLIDAVRHGGNLSVGSGILPGNAIKAVIAEGYAALNATDAGNFVESLHVSFAVPDGRKPLPLSLSISENRIFCNLEKSRPDELHKFQGDWKKDNATTVRAALGKGWEAPDSEIVTMGRSRTAIDTESLSAEFDEASGEGAGLLFAQTLLNHKTKTGDNLEFIGSLHGDANAPEFAQALGMLQSGLPGFGKTGAVITGQQIGRAKTTIAPTKDTINLCLVSPACMFHPEHTFGYTAKELYDDYFANLNLELENFFATQSLRGRYLALRYRVAPEKYAPWVLTNPGSVFRVKPTENCDLSNILEFGLPPAKGLSTDWRVFPFLRENGFGEVRHEILNHADLASVGICLQTKETVK